MNGWKKFIKIVGIVLALQLTGAIIIYWILPDWSSRGTFGDMFGAINTFFSGIALAGIIYTIFLQHKELGLQREELRFTREELGRTASAQEKSELALSKQARAAELTARLTALNNLIAQEDVIINNTTTYTSGSPEESQRKSSKQNKTKLLSELKRIHEKMMNI